MNLGNDNALWLLFIVPVALLPAYIWCFWQKAKALKIFACNEMLKKIIEVARLTIKDILDQLKNQQQQDPNQPQDSNQQQQQDSKEDTNQSQQQEPEQQQQQAQEKDEEQKQKSDTTVQEILDKERRDKKQRQILQRARYQKVEKDW